LRARSEKYGGARMETVEELPQQELIVLRDIHVSGRSNNHAIVRQLIRDGMIVDDERLELTANGRRSARRPCGIPRHKRSLREITDLNLKQPRQGQVAARRGSFVLDCSTASATRLQMA
jgi:hypothetical protein